MQECVKHFSWKSSKVRNIGNKLIPGNISRIFVQLVFPFHSKCNESFECCSKNILAKQLGALRTQTMTILQTYIEDRKIQRFL